jgi:Fe-S cluster assembly protein SufD
LQASFPTTAHEDWKYTSLKKFLPLTNESNIGEESTFLDLKTLPQEAITLHWIDGVLKSETSRLPSAMEISFSDNTISSKPEGLEVLSYLSNEKLCTITIKKTLDQPLILIHETKTESRHSSGVQLRVKLADLAQANVLFISHQRAGHLIDSQKIQVQLGKNAHCNLMDVMLNQQATRRLSNRIASLERDAHLHQLSVMLGGAMTRLDANVLIQGIGAHATINALALLKDQEHADFFSTIEHEKEHTTSHQLVKQVLANQSRGVFTGKVHIHPQAQQVSAQQLNKISCLDPRPKSIPDLN